MMILKGNVGKSVVLCSIINTVSDIYVVVYDKDPLNMVDSLFISSKHHEIEELCDFVYKDIQSECKRKECVVIYTNLPESNTIEIKRVVEKLEQEELCRYGIVMCKE